MHVLLDSSPLLGPAAGRGLGRYTEALRDALRTFADVEEVAFAPAVGRLGELRQLPARAAALRRSRADVVYTPTAYQATFRPGSPWVCAVPDVIPLDLPEYRRTGLKAQLLHRLAARADAVLTLSDHAAGRIHELLHVPRSRIVVAPLPVPPGVRPAAGGLPAPAGLERGGYFVGMIDLASPDPRKRANWLVELAPQLTLPLVVVGAGTEHAVPGAEGRGRVADAEWSALLGSAAAFVYTSAYEGQGLPPLEAMSCGAPVVAMANTAVVEVVGDAGELVDEGPRAVERLAARCNELAADGARRRRLQEAGLVRAAGFSEARFVEQVRRAAQVAQEQPA